MCQFKEYHKYGGPKPRDNQTSPYGGCWPDGEYEYFKGCNEQCPYYYRDDNKKTISCNTCYWPDLWICGKYFEDIEQERRWEFIGVYDSEEKAVKACLFESYFVAPAKLNESMPDEKVEWKGAYYPLIQESNGTL